MLLETWMSASLAECFLGRIVRVWTTCSLSCSTISLGTLHTLTTFSVSHHSPASLQSRGPSLPLSLTHTLSPTHPRQPFPAETVLRVSEVLNELETASPSHQLTDIAHFPRSLFPRGSALFHKVGVASGRGHMTIAAVFEYRGSWW